jgi:hypothetical protein
LGIDVGRAEFKGGMLQKDTSLVNPYWHGFHLHTNKFELFDIDDLVVLLGVMEPK